MLLFTREAKSTDANHPKPYVFHDTATYVEHRRDKPMAVTWRLAEPMPEELFRRAAVAA
ncbi:hypothetical protein CS0771_31650 [Catellatospora sp. IY07-71]|nr:hypothetical protein CS0771_31650 [Catellatospora sp. IY07-71]